VASLPSSLLKIENLVGIEREKLGAQS